MCFLLVTSSLHKQRKVTRSPKGSESLCLCSRSNGNGNGNGNQDQDQDQDQGLSPAFGARAHLSLLVQRKVAQRKHTLPTRLPRCALQVHSAAGIFRRYILVSSKNDVRPARRPVRGLVCQLRRCGRGPVGQGLEQRQRPKPRPKPKPKPELPSPQPLSRTNGRGAYSCRSLALLCRSACARRAEAGSKHREGRRGKMPRFQLLRPS